MGKTLLERFIAQLNANVFFAEFAFDSAQIRIPGKGDIELADHLVLLDDIGIIFQLKERDAGAEVSAAALRTWFAQKVRKHAVAQVRDTRLTLAQFRGVELTNQRGHKVPLQASPTASLPGVVVYEAPSIPDFVPPHHCVSRRAGFIHFIRAADYLGVCQFLVTPTEVVDYLAFREQAMRALDFAPQFVSESALVGQYMGGDPTALPNERFAGALGALIQDQEKWDVSFLTERMGDQISFRDGSDTSTTSHYRILAEMAKLSRSELRTLKERLVRTLDAVRANRFELPYRFAVPRTDCGFLLLPVQREQRASMRTALHNFTLASKYDFKVSKHIGIAINSERRHIDILWMFVDGAFEPNPALESLLRENNPFRRTLEQMQPRYQFDTDALRERTGELPSLPGTEPKVPDK